MTIFETVGLTPHTTLINAGTYSVAVDIWSVGIIMYIIFAKKFPYQSHQLEVDKGRPSIQFDIPQFSNLTVDCTNLMRAMLDVDAATRISAADALTHCWFNSDVQGKYIGPFFLLSIVLMANKEASRFENCICTIAILEFPHSIHVWY